MDTTSFRGPRPEVLGPVVGIVLGSDSDRPVMEEAARTLAEFGIVHELAIASAHRSPDLLARYAHSVEARGIRVLIAAAGGAPHPARALAGPTVPPGTCGRLGAPAMGRPDGLRSTGAVAP